MNINNNEEIFEKKYINKNKKGKSKEKKGKIKEKIIKNDIKNKEYL